MGPQLFSRGMTVIFDRVHGAGSPSIWPAMRIAVMNTSSENGSEKTYYLLHYLFNLLQCLAHKRGQRPKS